VHCPNFPSAVDYSVLTVPNVSVSSQLIIIYSLDKPVLKNQCRKIGFVTFIFRLYTVVKAISSVSLFKLLNYFNLVISESDTGF